MVIFVDQYFNINSNISHINGVKLLLLTHVSLRWQIKQLCITEVEASQHDDLGDQGQVIECLKRNLLMHQQQTRNLNPQCIHVSSWFIFSVYSVLSCLQCFDTVGWASGRASGLERFKWCGVGLVFCPERGADCLHVVPAVATAIPKPHCLLPHLNPDWFYLSGAGLPRFSWRWGRLNRCAYSMLNSRICALSCMVSFMCFHCPHSVHCLILLCQYQTKWVFSALTLFFGRQEGHPACKNWVVGCWHGYLSGARCRLAYGPADATATHCFSKIQIGFTFLVLAHLGSPWTKSR